MRISGLLFISLALLVLNTACASKSVQVKQYNAQSQKVSSIAVVEDMAPARMQTKNLAGSRTRWGDAGAVMNSIPSPGAFALTGLANVIGGKMVRSEQDEINDRELQSVMKPMAFDAESKFQSTLKQKLSMAGFEDGGMVGSNRNKRTLLDNYPDTDADAILDVNIVHFGAIKRSHNSSFGWQPWSVVQVRLISSDDKSILMENQVSYNHGYPVLKDKTIKLFSYDGAKTYEKLVKIDADAMAKDMDIMIDEVTDAVIALLGKTVP